MGLGTWRVAFWLLCPVDLEAAPDFFGDFPGHLLTGALTALRALPMDDETLGSGEGGLWLFGYRAWGVEGRGVRLCRFGVCIRTSTPWKSFVVNCIYSRNAFQPPKPLNPKP